MCSAGIVLATAVTSGCSTVGLAVYESVSYRGTFVLKGGLRIARGGAMTSEVLFSLNGGSPASTESSNYIVSFRCSLLSDGYSHYSAYRCYSYFNVENLG